VTEQRRPSDTVRIDHDELARALEASRMASERETGRSCPACGGTPRPEPCDVCKGDGWVAMRVWNSWVERHGAACFVDCPQCHREGKILITTGTGSSKKWHPEKCPLCAGAKRVRGNIAIAHEREQARKESP
jgi:DnaJ-class molecular chaperone